MFPLAYNLELKLESADQSQCTNNGNELTLLPENSQKILSFKIPVKNESIIEVIFLQISSNILFLLVCQLCLFPFFSRSSFLSLTHTLSLLQCA
jgi:hypothetical protein